MFDNVQIVLVETSHSGNIGSAARAMLTMGFKRLVLVNPAADIDGKSVALAAGAGVVLENAKIVDTVAEAVANSSLVIGTSARSRTLDWPMLDGRSSGEKVAQQGDDAEVSIVFGREAKGLSNEELQLCNYHVCLPANPDYTSLNLAMAVQILCYEMRVALLNKEQYPVQEQEYPLHQDLENFYQHFEESLYQTGFILKSHPGKVMDKLRRLFNRIRMDKQELNMMRGVLASIERTAKGLTKP
ncbi:tRNA (cytosine(32)/uridine(32)-2'-O)-methyltransferase TrmJ [Alginatibacterium sediminis]|uniref:tRNA (cytidine/uridine-2'-O-)-methyltransferase TrmJ n=1 Tax=Alginatibacterium sediminis TaxID=2164068 RepID=A0A420E7M0_9ALTE|nr:tRNA (cytosine(32)/uridine(32)-2'-O)-methyltransferase TrmJ [Alginatibacterium sediminis]RKF15539.1 tRNA (cytosine(32)/uridine(32)-2'-O)-methyltransferase TrmJ [Alginatibacterium sediminis]